MMAMYLMIVVFVAVMEVRVMEFQMDAIFLKIIFIYMKAMFFIIQM